MAVVSGGGWYLWDAEERVWEPVLDDVGREVEVPGRVVDDFDLGDVDDDAVGEEWVWTWDEGEPI